MPQVAKKISEIIERMNSIARRRFDGDGQPITDFEIARLKNEAKALPDAIDKEVLLGMIATIEVKYASTIKHFNLALSFDPSNVDTLRNYAIALDHLGRYEEAKDKSLQAYSFAKGDKKLIDLIIHHSVLSGDFISAFEWLNEWDKVSPNESHEDAQLVAEVYSFINREEISVEKIQDSIRIATNAAFKLSVPISKVGLSFVENEGKEWLSYSVNVYCSLSDVEKMNDILIDGLIDEFGAEPLEFIVINYVHR